MMTCDEAVAALWRHLEDDVAVETADGDAAALDDHLGRCRRCCGEAEFAGMLRELWTRTAADAVPTTVRRRLEVTLIDLGEPTALGEPS